MEKERINYWEDFLLFIQSSRERKLRKLYMTCRKWLDAQDSTEAFESFFDALWRMVDRTSLDYDVKLLGGSGKVRKLTGRALEGYIYHVLKRRLSNLKFEQRVPLLMKVSFVPDISVWKNHDLKAILECKVGCSFQDLKAIAMESYILKRLGLGVPVLVVTRSGLRQSHEKAENQDEIRIVKEFVTVFYLSIERKSKELEKEIECLIRYIEVLP